MQTAKKTFRLPAHLSPGDAVGIVAPASPFDRPTFERGATAIEAMGYRPVFSEGLFSRHGYLAGSDRHRAQQFSRVFCDPQIKAVLCARGGFGSLRILPHLDYERIGRHTKIFIGFSDLTALLAALGRHAGLAAFHGPTVIGLADAARETLDSLAETLRLGIPGEIRPREGAVIRGGRASGPLVGGNLTTLCHLLGTPFSPEYRGAILLLEDRGEKPYRIDRKLAHMRLAGCFDGLAGVVLGEFVDCGDTDAIHCLVDDAVDDPAIPILAGLAVGHGGINLTVPMGFPAVLETEPRRLRFAAADPGI
jgi:muramoyltetrapeptide carboxypeptidase